MFSLKNLYDIITYVLECLEIIYIDNQSSEDFPTRRFRIKLPDKIIPSQNPYYKNSLPEVHDEST